MRSPRQTASWRTTLRAIAIQCLALQLGCAQDRTHEASGGVASAAPHPSILSTEATKSADSPPSSATTRSAPVRHSQVEIRTGGLGDEQYGEEAVAGDDFAQPTNALAAPQAAPFAANLGAPAAWAGSGPGGGGAGEVGRLGSHSKVSSGLTGSANLGLLGKNAEQPETGVARGWMDAPSPPKAVGMPVVVDAPALGQAQEQKAPFRTATEKSLDWENAGGTESLKLEAEKLADGKGLRGLRDSSAERERSAGKKAELRQELLELDDEERDGDKIIDETDELNGDVDAAQFKRDDNKRGNNAQDGSRARGKDEEKQRQQRLAPTGRDSGYFAITDQVAIDQDAFNYAEGEVAPTAFLPDMFYFENTYLGGDAGYRESLRRLDGALQEVGAPHRLARLPSQGFDAPEHDGMGVVSSLNRTSLDGPGRVFLQVGLRGSERFGWRRPPLELVAVIDGPALDGDVEAAQALVSALLQKLGPQDSLAVIVAGEDAPLAGLDSPRHHRSELLPRLERDLDVLPAEGSLPAALTQAGWMLAEANKHRTTAPGTQVVLILTSAQANVPAAAPFVSQLTLGGIVTSVIGVGSTEDAGQLWQLAAAGHGNVHTAELTPDYDDDRGNELDGEPADDGHVLAAVGAAVDSELDLLARVVARLLRVNVKLAPGVKVVRVLGSRPLLDEEVRVVKAREVETDRRLSQVLGIQADRGDDDDGVQTVIPVFYGGDAHVLVFELWAEGPGAIADVTLRYKDMVNLENRAARTSVAVRGSAREATALERGVVRNRAAFEASEQLSAAAAAMRQNDFAGALALLNAAGSKTGRSFAALVARVQTGELAAQLVAESLELAARRAVGGGA